MALNILSVDDSKMANNVISRQLKTLEPNALYQSFTDPKELIAHLETSYSKSSADNPWVIFTDLNMPRFDGMDLLSWVKRHPTFHFLPVVFVSAEGDTQVVKDAESLGAMSFLNKPLNSESLASIFKKLPTHYAEIEILEDIEASFPEECSEIIAEVRALVKSGLSRENLKQVYRSFHTIKGNSRSIQYPVLASFVHRAESFLKAVSSLNLFKMPKAEKILTEVLDYLDECVTSIREKKQMKVPCEDLEKDIVHFVDLLGDGEDLSFAPDTPQPELSSAAPVNSEPKGQNLENGVLSKNATSIRITNSKLDNIQELFKNVMRHRLKITRFANALKTEFYDESFPNDLLKIADSMTTDTTQIMDFFLALRTVSIRRLENVVNLLTTQTSATLGKQVSLNFQADKGIEIDQAVSEELENSLGHIIRNCIDHGIEKTGNIEVKVSIPNSDELEITISDDGRGIDTEKLKEKIIATQLMTQNSIENLKQEQLLDLIFLDNVSAKDSADELSGRGVGMSAVKQSIEGLSGSITVSSELGKGTKFEIKVPRFFKL